jgi:glyceraldehyde 3-phosphate dehydrogenase
MGPTPWGFDSVKVVSWYDNERGYSCRVADLLIFLEDKGLEAAAAGCR